MKKILPILILGLIISCSDTPSGSEENEKTFTNFISEVYFLHGRVIGRNSDCSVCTDKSDTTKITTAVSVKYLEENPDSVQFFGLDGANSGYESAFPQDCTANEVLNDYCTYAENNNGLITLDLFRSGYAYKAEGTLEGDEMTLNGTYTYRGDSVGYDLAGQKVDGIGGVDEPEYYRTGLYFVGGEKITTTYSDWPIPEGEEPEVDTVRVEFSTHLKVQDDQETIRFVGLHGADTGEMENRVYPNCMNSEDCVILGQSTGIESFEIDIENNGRTYMGSGIARSTDFQLTGQYQYQNTTIDYDLEGHMYIE